MKPKPGSCLLLGLGIVAFFALCSSLYTIIMVTVASRDGVYPTAEQGMIALNEKYYTPDLKVKILYAGTHSFDGSGPHIWFVIAEFRASAHADGSQLRKNGCDSGSSFFLQTRKGWVFMSEAAFPEYVGKWMKILGLAGPGQATPSTNWAPDQNPHYCTE